jgi:hypothetical protein
MAFPCFATSFTFEEYDSLLPQGDYNILSQLYFPLTGGRFVNQAAKCVLLLPSTFWKIDVMVYISTTSWPITK